MPNMQRNYLRYTNADIFAHTINIEWKIASLKINSITMTKIILAIPYQTMSVKRSFAFCEPKLCCMVFVN